MIRERALQKKFTGKQIIEEVVALGYAGSSNRVYELLRWMRIGRLPSKISKGQRSLPFKLIDIRPNKALGSSYRPQRN